MPKARWSKSPIQALREGLGLTRGEFVAVLRNRGLGESGKTAAMTLALMRFEAGIGPWPGSLMELVARAWPETVHESRSWHLAMTAEPETVNESRSVHRVMSANPAQAGERTVPRGK